MAAVKMAEKGRGGLVKKFKGKKKVRNLAEKKAKGLHLNKVDRKKWVKENEKKRVKEEVAKKVKANLEELEERSLSSLSESSFGSQPPPKKKRVSFSAALEHKKVFDKNDKSLEIKASTASPGKSILKEKARRKKELAEKRKRKLSGGEETTSEDVEMEEEGAKENKKVVKSLDGVKKKKRVIQVTKSIKEKLMNLPRKERKALIRELAAKKKPHFELAQKAKKEWEIIRSGRTKDADKKAALDRLTSLVQGHLKTLVYGHDTSRVLQCLFKERRAETRKMFFDELFPETIKMAKSNYARFFVVKMMKLGTKSEREQIIASFRGHCLSLFRVAHSAEVLELAFNDYCTQQQRWDILAEFYGKEFVLFRTEESRPIERIVEEEPAKKKGIVKHLEEVVMDIVDKTTVRTSLAHKLMLDLMTYGDKEQRDNLMDSIKDKLPEFVHTADGTLLAMKCVWNSNAKDRKLIVKNMKDLALKVASDVHGCRTLMAIFDSVDDTVLVNKVITQELANNVKELLDSKAGVRTAHYLVHPRDGRVMLKRVYDLLAQGDGNEHSKKPAEERYSELFRCFSKGLFPYVAANMYELLFERSETAYFVLDALEPRGKYEFFTRQVEPSDRKACYEAITELAGKEFIPCDTGNEHIIEHRWAGFVLSKLVKYDSQFPEEEQLSTHLAKLSDEQLGSWVGCNKGCFILLRMVENGSEAVRAKVRSSVNMKRLESYSNKGAGLLHKALKGN